MTNPAPVVYILHGDDEFAVNQFVSGLKAKVEDSGMAVMNITRLDGRTNSFEEIQSAVSAIPFLAERRIVILIHPLSKQNLEDRLRSLLDEVPQSTAFVLVENKPLMDKWQRRRGEFHWLEEWSDANPGRAFIREFTLPRGGAMIRWIMDQAQSKGGSFTPHAAAQLAELVGDNPRLASMEIEKLLAYVNYSRPVEIDDIEVVTVLIPEGDIFAMVDALVTQDGKKAMGMLQRLFETQDPASIFGMVVRQFRLMILARDVMDRGGNPADLIREYKVKTKLHPYLAEKSFQQARHFDKAVLESVYHRLLEIDEAVKTGRVQGDLALDTFVAGFTSQGRVSLSR